MSVEKAYWEYVVNEEEMRRADENTIAHFGVPQLVLMERAALSAKDAILEKWPELAAGGFHILLLAGNGNNGGDGAALARLFYLQGHRVTVLVSGKAERYSPAMKTQMEILERYLAAGKDRNGSGTSEGCLEILPEEVWQHEKGQRERTYDLVVDALFGIGLSRPVEGINREKIRWMNGLAGRKAALDIPSGLSAGDGRAMGEAFRADLTVTFGFLKTGMLLYPGRELCGAIRVADIGITGESFLGQAPAGMTTIGEMEGGRLRHPREILHIERRKDGHKGSFGKVLLFAGSKGTPGAALLAGEAVLRSGAGMLKIVSPAENRELVLTKLPEAMYQELTEDTDWEELLGWCDAAVAGPGIGQGKAAKESLAKILTLLSGKFRDRPLLLDADALNLIACSEELSGQVRALTASGGIVIMTPHMAEFARLSHCSMKMLQEERMERAEHFLRESGVILVSKDAATVVCHIDDAGIFRYYINRTGNSGMATAGSGDVLTGMAGAFAAFSSLQCRGEHGDAPEGTPKGAQSAYFEAACRAVYAHGAAGDRAAEKYGEVSMKAGDMLRALPELFMT